MNKLPTLSDKELIKWTNILGTYRMKELYFMGKINLTKEQLDKLIELEKEDDKKLKIYYYMLWDQLC
jgi:hypothetical protein